MQSGTGATLAMQGPGGLADMVAGCQGCELWREAPKLRTRKKVWGGSEIWEDGPAFQGAGP